MILLIISVQILISIFNNNLEIKIIPNYIEINIIKIIYKTLIHLFKLFLLIKRFITN